jgi:hypothetical protein
MFAHPHPHQHPHSHPMTISAAEEEDSSAAARAPASASDQLHPHVTPGGTAERKLRGGGGGDFIRVLFWKRAAFSAFSSVRQSSWSASSLLFSRKRAAFSVWTEFPVVTRTGKNVGSREDFHCSHACKSFKRSRCGNQWHPRVKISVEKRAPYNHGTVPHHRPCCNSGL